MTKPQSTTLKFVIVSYALVSLKYLLAGVELPMLGLMADMSANDYAMAITLILTIWLGREWRETHYKVKSQEVANKAIEE